MSNSQIVKNNSEAYGYNYASLADIVKQGFTIPIMETRNIEGKTFVGWLDNENGWHQGAPLVIPEMKGMNTAQAMGSALTYARRYTAQMALGLACDDDSKLEKTNNAPGPTGNASNKKIDFRQVREKIISIQEVDELIKYWMSLSLSDKQANVLKADFTKRKKELEGEDGMER